MSLLCCLEIVVTLKVPWLGGVIALCCNVLDFYYSALSFSSLLFSEVICFMFSCRCLIPCPRLWCPLCRCVLYTLSCLHIPFFCFTLCLPCLSCVHVCSPQPVISLFFRDLRSGSLSLFLVLSSSVSITLSLFVSSALIVSVFHPAPVPNCVS